MTPEERQMLTDLANKIAQTPPPAREPEAEDFIRTRIGSRPDALYILTQTVLIQNMAIDHAKQEIEQLKRTAQAPPAQASGSFLGGGSGWGGGAPAQAQSPAYGPPPVQPGMASPQPAAGGSGMGSFLRSAGTTAAGVAAGALAFEGIRSMFGGVEHMFGFGNPSHMGTGSSFLGGGQPEETIINNYYDRPGGHGQSVADDLGPDDSTRYDSTETDDAADSDDTDNDDTDNVDDSSSSDDLV